MNHIANIAKKLPEYGLDAMLITSPSGERYALGFHGEGLLLVTRDGARYTTDGRYIEAGSGGISSHRRQRPPVSGQGIYPGPWAAQRRL